MAIKTIKYEVNVTGITPMTEQFGGTQGDHRVAQIEFTLARVGHGEGHGSPLQCSCLENSMNHRAW